MALTPVFTFYQIEPLLGTTVFPAALEIFFPFKFTLLSNFGMSKMGFGSSVDSMNKKLSYQLYSCVV